MLLLYFKTDLKLCFLYKRKNTTGLFQRKKVDESSLKMLLRNILQIVIKCSSKSIETSTCFVSGLIIALTAVLIVSYLKKYFRYHNSIQAHILVNSSRNRILSA